MIQSERKDGGEEMSLQKARNGGPAFPFEGRDFIWTGLTIRDYFAAQALEGMLSHSTRYRPRDGRQDWHSAIAEEAYELGRMTDCLLTLRFRLRDKHAAELNRQARAVNVVWNYLNETQRKAAVSGRKWFSDVDLQRLTSGSSSMLGIPSQTICRLCRQYVRSRKQKNRPWLRFRGRNSLGWIPLHEQNLKIRGGTIYYSRQPLRLMHWRDLPPVFRVCESNFSRDRKGRWYLNLNLSVPVEQRSGSSKPIGIDLGLSSLATLSDGHKICPPQFYRSSERALALAQKRRKPKRIRNIHAKIANRRRDFIHKLSNTLTKEYGLIVVGDVSSKKLAQTNMAKSVLDAGWSDLKAKLAYKSIRNGGSYLEVSERLTTQTCSECGSLPPSRPRGIAGLSKRAWECDCGAVHDRDVNAARNILRIGLDTLSGGTAQMRGKQP